MAIVSRAQTRTLAENTYTERHHVVPRCLGGSNDPENIAVLTAREHFICHRLLVNMTTGKAASKMALAVLAMCRTSGNQQRAAVRAHTYARIREAVSRAATGAGNPNYGKTHSAETRKLMSAGVLATRAQNGPIQLDTKAREKIAASKRGKPRPKWIIDKMTAASQLLPRDHNKGRTWYNNGVRSFLAKESPPGCVPGRLPY